MRVEQVRERIWQERARGRRQADIALAVGVHPTTVSAIVRGLIPIRDDDPRLKKLARVLGQ